MFSLDHKLASLTCVAKRPMGQIKSPSSISPHPMCSQNSFHPFLHPSSLTDSTAKPHLSKPSQPSLLHPTSQTSTSYLPYYILPPILHPTSQTSTPHSCIVHPRKPHTGHSIIHNELCPHMPATDCIFSWHTPFSSRHHATIAQRLPAPLVESVLMAIQGALAPNTKSTYGAGPLYFTQFCDKWGITKEACMPADYTLLCTFIGEFKGLQSGNTIFSWLSGLCSWHLVNHAPWYGDDDWVHLAWTSANKEGTKHKLAPRAPVSIEHLSCLHRSLNLSSPFHAAVWVVALTTFFGCRHLGGLSDAPQIPAGFQSFLQIPVDFRGINFGRDISQNYNSGGHKFQQNTFIPELTLECSPECTGIWSPEYLLILIRFILI